MLPWYIVEETQAAYILVHYNGYMPIQSTGIMAVHRKIAKQDIIFQASTTFPNTLAKLRAYQESSLQHLFKGAVHGG